MTVLARTIWPVIAVFVLAGCLRTWVVYGQPCEPVVFEDGRPRLRWEPFPSEAELRADDQGLPARSR